MSEYLKSSLPMTQIASQVQSLGFLCLSSNLLCSMAVREWPIEGKEFPTNRSFWEPLCHYIYITNSRFDWYAK